MINSLCEVRLVRRPTTWDDLIGQAKAQQLLKGSIQVARKHDRALPHILLTGPAGTGKTTIANLIAHSRGTQFTSVTSTSITSPRDVAVLVSGQEPNSVLFIDEIHRMARRVQETFYSVMEDFHVTWKAGRSMAKLEMEPFAVIGATTDVGLLLKPMRDRFGIIVHLEEYTEQELTTIISNYCKRSTIACVGFVPLSVAKRSKGTPRTALNIIDRAYETAVVAESPEGTIHVSHVTEACELIGIDESGLDRYDHAYLAALAESYPDAVSLRTIASRANLAEVTILTSIEPYLIKKRMVEISSKGRTLQGVHLEQIRSVQREVA